LSILNRLITENEKHSACSNVYVRLSNRGGRGSESCRDLLGPVAVDTFRSCIMLIRKRPYVSIGAAGAVILGGLAVHHAQSSPVPNPAPAAATEAAPAVSNAVDLPREALGNMNLHFATAELRPLMRTTQVTGVVGFNAKRLAQVSSPSRGRIEAIDVVVGQHVHAGQRLAILLVVKAT
jgi:biotin carboxyl carrier protein